MNQVQDEDNGIIPNTEVRPSSEAFTSESHVVNTDNRVKSQPEKLFSCNYCTYTTRYQGNLVKHVRIHTGHKPYACRFCGKRFASQSNHTEHETIHTGQKRLKCPYDDCIYRTNKKLCLGAHLMQWHGDSCGKVTPRRRKSIKTDKSPSQSPASSLDLSLQQRRQFAAANHEQSQDHSNDLSRMAATPWSTHAYMQTLDLEELAEYGGTLHETKNLYQTNRSDSTEAITSLAANALVTRSEPMRTQIPNIITSTFICNRNPNDDLQQNMNPEAEVNNSPRPQVGLDDTNQSLNSQNNKQSMDQQQVSTWQDDANPSTRGALQGDGSQQQGPPPLIPIDLYAAQAAAAALGHQDPMPLAAGENRSSELSKEILQLLSKFELDPQIIVDTLISQGKLYRCVSCNIIFPEYDTFVLHKGCHGDHHPYQCHFCQVIFPDEFCFLSHFMQCQKK